MVTFIAGLVLGGAGVFYYGWHSGSWHHPWRESATIHKLTKRLSLTPQEVKQLRPIMDAAVKQWNQIESQTKPQLQALRQQTDDRIRQILNTGQREKFDALVREHAAQEKNTNGASGKAAPAR
ncbi:MAG: hypothetical protein ACRD10_14425 [Terriglobia bacterium]